MSLKLVKILDKTTGETVEIPEAELAPGMVKVHNAETGVGCFTEAQEIKPGILGTTSLPEWFPGLAVLVLDSLGPVGRAKWTPNSWVEEFTADAHPVCELGIWMGLAAALSELTHNLKDSIEVQSDTFRALLEVVNNGFSAALQTFSPERISKARARSAMQRMRDFGAKDLVEFWAQRTDADILEKFVAEWKHQQAHKRGPA